MIAQARDLARSGVAREIRLRAGLSLQEIGRAAGVSHAAVAAWEGGKMLPRGDHAVRYAEVLQELEYLQREGLAR